MYARYALYVEGHPTMHAEVEVYRDTVRLTPDETYIQDTVYVYLYLGKYLVSEVDLNVSGPRPRDWVGAVNNWIEMLWGSIQADAKAALEEALSLVPVVHPSTLVFSSDIDSCARLAVPLKSTEA